MNISMLEAIPIIKLYGSYADASKATGIPVSTLSKWVTRVENELGVAIFERKTQKNSVTLTEQGKILLPLIQRLVNTNSFMLKRAEYLRGSESDRLSVGLPSTLGGMGYSELMSDYMAENPAVELVSVFQSHDDLVRLLLDGMIECSFFVMNGSGASGEDGGVFGSDQYETAVINRSRCMYIGISSRDSLSERESLTIDELRYQCFIFNKWHDTERRAEGRGVSFFEHLGQDEDNFELMFEDFISRNYVFSLVARGVGVLPQAFLPHRPIPGVRFVPLRGWDQTTSVVFAARRFGSRPLRSFTDFVKARAI